MSPTPTVEEADIIAIGNQPVSLEPQSSVHRMLDSLPPPPIMSEKDSREHDSASPSSPPPRAESAVPDLPSTFDSSSPSTPGAAQPERHSISDHEPRTSVTLRPRPSLIQVVKDSLSVRLSDSSQTGHAEETPKVRSHASLAAAVEPDLIFTVGDMNEPERSSPARRDADAEARQSVDHDSSASPRAAAIDRVPNPPAQRNHLVTRPEIVAVVPRPRPPVEHLPASPPPVVAITRQPGSSPAPPAAFPALEPPPREPEAAKLVQVPESSAETLPAAPASVAEGAAAAAEPVPNLALELPPPPEEPVSAEPTATAPAIEPPAHAEPPAPEPAPAPMPIEPKRPTKVSVLAPSAPEPALEPAVKLEVLERAAAMPAPTEKPNLLVVEKSPPPSPATTMKTPAVDLVTHRRIDVTPRQTTVIRTGHEVVRAEALDRSICDVVHLSAYEVTVVGKHEGATHVRLWFKDQNGPSTNYLVTVLPPQQVAQQADRQWERLRDTLRELYPDANISLVPSGGKLIVQGTVASDDEAIQILSLVRRVQLIPIVDRLVVKRSPR